MKNETIAKIGATAEVMGNQLSESGLDLMVDDLECYPDEDIIHALKRMRRDGTRFTVAEIVKRLPNMWPGAEQAWAEFPKDQSQTACVTQEMLDAWVVAEDLDDIAGRMAFKEAYARRVSEAMSEGRKPEWRMTLGTDPQQRDEAVLQALEKGLLPVPDAVVHLPNYSQHELQALSQGSATVTGLLTDESRQESRAVPKLLAEAINPAERDSALKEIAKLKDMLSGGSEGETA